MRVLELFSGTGSVAKVVRADGGQVTSLDWDPKNGADIQCDILEWNYRALPRDSFNVIWASPDCRFYSCMQERWLKGEARERKMQQSDRFVKRVVHLFTVGYQDVEKGLKTSLPEACPLLRDAVKGFHRSIDIFDFSERKSMRRAAEVVVSAGGQRREHAQEHIVLSSQQRNLESYTQ